MLPCPTGETAICQGFIKDYAYTLGWEKTKGWPILPGTVVTDIMGMFTPQALAQNGLARLVQVERQREALSLV